MSQEKLAEKADLNSAYISDVELGEENVLVGTLIRIAKALGHDGARIDAGILVIFALAQSLQLVWTSYH